MAGTGPDGLERSCVAGGGATGSDWARIAPAGPGIELLQARFAGHAFDRHRHDVYAIGVTMFGVQEFACRGAMRASIAGRALVIHPDEAHDGHAGSPAGFGYRMVYVAPALIRDALGGSAALPFVSEITVDDPQIRRAVHRAFERFPAPPESLAVDRLVLDLAVALAHHDRSHRPRPAHRIAPARVERAREFLDANLRRRVASDELEQVSGLDRFSLTRQFRARLGTSPYRYLTMRRLEAAKRMILGGAGPAEAAAAAGFADQAHLTRQFKAAFGMPPGRFAKLVRR